MHCPGPPLQACWCPPQADLPDTQPPLRPRAVGSSEVHASAGKVSVVDTVGAGDFFTAGFLYALLSNASLQVGARILLFKGGGEDFVPLASSL